MTRLSIWAAAIALAPGAALPAAAQDWSDTALGYRYGTDFAEPYVGDGIHKHIASLTWANGYRYGGNYVNLDILKSDRRDAHAREAYLLYRHTLDLGKATGRSFTAPGLRGLGLTAGVDLNTKNDPGYGSRKRMLVAGPTLMLDVPGFLNVSLLALWESNHPRPVAARYRYDTHAMLSAAWDVPVGQGWTFGGYLNFIGAKGKDEFGAATAPETNLDMQLMFDASAMAGMKPETLRVGVGYQYWRNKFGNASTVPGSLARTPMLRAEYHF